MDDPAKTIAVVRGGSTVDVEQTFRTLVDRWQPGLRESRRAPGVNVNALMPSGPESFETLSNQQQLTGVAVTVAPLT